MGVKAIKERTGKYDIMAHDEPYIVERLVRWGECDPAGIVYTPNFIDYAVDASRLFIREMIRRAFGAPATSGLSLPVKTLTATFHSPLRCDELLKMRLVFTRLGQASFDIAVHGYRGQPSDEVFDLAVTFVNVENNLRRAVPLSGELRGTIEMQLRPSTL